MRKRGETVGKTPLVDHILQERFIGDRKECTDHEGKTGKKREPGWFWLGEGLGRGRGLGRLLIKSFRLKVWAEEAVKSRPMLCPDVLSVLMGSLAGRKRLPAASIVPQALTLYCPIKAFTKYL